MKKETLNDFIDRYSLGGLITKVKWKYSAVDKTIHTRSVIDNKSFLVDVVKHDFSDFGDEDVSICIGDTNKVKLMIAPFEDEINISINKNGDRILGFTLSNNDLESYCSTADPSSLDPVPKTLNDLPDYDVVILLTEEFIEKFLKAHAALKDVDSFSVGMNKKGLFEVVIGYSTSNSNRIRITPPTDPIKNKIGQAITFPIKNVLAALKANSDIPNGTLSINSSGIIKIYFKNDKFTNNYFQFCNKIK